MRLTRQRFVALCKKLGARDGPDRTIDKTYDEVIASYTEPRRHYHNIDHIDDGLAELDPIRRLAEDPDVLEAGWIMHDKIYVPGNKFNEEESATDAERIFKELGLKPLSRIKVLQRISATVHTFIPGGNDDRLMVDIDLVSLGAPWEIFESNARKIRLEYGLPEEVFKKGRVAFFVNFLKNRPIWDNRPSVFLTDHFRAKYEVRAQENISRFLASEK